MDVHAIAKSLSSFAVQQRSGLLSEAVRENRTNVFHVSLVLGAAGSQEGSGLAFGLEHGRGERLAAVLAGPDDELESLVVALAGL